MFLSICFWVFTTLLILCESKPPVLTAKEKAAVDRLRLAVGGKLTARYMKSDAYLVKWVKAKNFDHEESRGALEKTLEWRRKVNADNFPFEKVPEDLTKKFVFDFSYKDKNGAQVLLMPYGDWDVRRKALEGKIPQLSNRMDWMEERLAQLSYNLTGDPTSIALVDMNGYSLRRHGCIGCMPLYVTWVKHHELHFPYNMYKIVLFNTPSIFEPVLNIMRPFMTSSTKDALKVYGYDKEQWKKEIGETIDLDNFPIRFGGNGKSRV